eukprot:9472700-Pyramimonas_sp.AAC.1
MGRSAGGKWNPNWGCQLDFPSMSCRASWQRAGAIISRGLTRNGGGDPAAHTKARVPICAAPFGLSATAVSFFSPGKGASRALRSPRQASASSRAPCGGLYFSSSSEALRFTRKLQTCPVLCRSGIREPVAKFLARGFAAASLR